MKLEFIEVSKLKESPYNPRIHPEKALERLEKSIEKFGFTNPILVQKSTNQIIAGHARLKAAKEAGLKKVPVIFLDFDDVTAKAYNITDNRLAGLTEWDYPKLKDLITDIDTGAIDIELTGFDEIELKEIIDYDSGNGKEETFDVDAELEKIKKAKTKTGDLYQLGEHRLLCGDATKKEDVERLMDGKKADMVFTDPPYGVAYADKNKYLNAISRGNCIQVPITNDHETVQSMYKLWCNIFNIMGEYTTNKASYYICSPQGGELMMMMMMQAIDQSPFSLKHTIIWVKNNHVLGRADYNYKHEPILYGWKKKGTHIFYGEGEFLTSVWDVNKPFKSDLHPTMKPIALMENALLNSSQENDICLDLFGGSGSTLIACEKTNRKCRMMEIDQLYCDVIIKRWEDFASKKAILIK